MSPPQVFSRSGRLNVSTATPASRHLVEHRLVLGGVGDDVVGDTHRMILLRLGARNCA